jgi:hypothetical protein
MYLNRKTAFWVVGKTTPWLRIKLSKHVWRRTAFFVSWIVLLISLLRVDKGYTLIRSEDIRWTLMLSGILAGLITFIVFGRYLKNKDQQRYEDFLKRHAAKVVCLRTKKYRAGTEYDEGYQLSHGEYYYSETYANISLIEEMRRRQMYTSIAIIDKSFHDKSLRVLDRYFEVIGPSAYLLNQPELSKHNRQLLEKTIDEHAKEAIDALITLKQK